jgi:hypothetical protein
MVKRVGTNLDPLRERDGQVEGRMVVALTLGLIGSAALRSTPIVSPDAGGLPGHLADVQRVSVPPVRSAVQSSTASTPWVSSRFRAPPGCTVRPCG